MLLRYLVTYRQSPILLPGSDFVQHVLVLVSFARHGRLEAAVIPAKAGIYSEDLRKYIVEGLDSRFRGNDRRFETDPMPNDTTTHVLPAPAQAHGLGGTRVCDCPPMHFDAINVKLLRSKICGLSESHEVQKRAVCGNIRRVSSSRLRRQDGCTDGCSGSRWSYKTV